jgi:demethylmenaquinone methyltransferase/2-methoxy-6-polyprenyl-1,4-benzoquinol methylase
MRQNWEVENFRADLTKQPAEVQAMFDRVANRYDLMNDLLSLGQTKSWRKATVAAIKPVAGEIVLDLAAGTGTSTAAIAATGAEAIACDLSLGMLEVGKKRHPELTFVAGDALALPFAANTFDAVTISFGIRNVQNVELALQELYRVTKPGGRLVICEFSTPEQRWFRKIYQNYLIKALPKVAARLSSNPVAYQYLAESILAWPDQAKFAAQIQQIGWQQVAWRSLTGGIVALHRGIKPVA